MLAGAIIAGAPAWSPAARAATPAAPVDTVDQLRYPPLPDVRIPEPTRVVLDNGLTILFLEDHELPIVSVSARIRTGSRLEPADKVGLAELTGAVMRSGGTAAMTGDQLDDYLEGRAARIETSIGVASGTAAMSCLREDFADVLTVFGDVLRHPRFDADKLAIAKNRAIADIARQNDNPGRVADREFAKLIYGKESPYARVPSYDTINGIVRRDLADWHAAYVHPRRVILGLVGDFDTEQALQLVTRVFGNWPRGPTVDDPDVPYPTATTRGVYIVPKHDMTQAKIVIGHMGLTRRHPDYYALVILNQILSGSFGSRLFSNIRSQQGLAYDVHGGIGFGWDVPPPTHFSMSTKLDTVRAGLDSLLEEVRKVMDAAPPTEEEVDNAKTSLLNSFVFSVDAPGKVLEQLLTHAYFGYPSDWLAVFRAGIERTTAQQVRKAARAQLKPEQFVTLVVGPRDGVAPAMARDDTVTEIDIAIPDPSSP